MRHRTNPAPTATPHGPTPHAPPGPRPARGRPALQRGGLVRLGFAIVLALATAGCASFSGEETRSGWDVGGDRRETVRLTVTNQNFSDARVYALWNGERRRLGLVTGNSSQTFTMDWRPGATLRIEVDFVAGGSFVSEGISSWPGETWEFIIPARVRD
jgi:hypothetical protein